MPAERKYIEESDGEDCNAGIGLHFRVRSSALSAMDQDSDLTCCQYKLLDFNINIRYVTTHERI